LAAKRNLKITLAYDGSPFNGWQIQPDRPSVQGALKEAIYRIAGEDLLPQGSGRTDAGVHALGQVASFAMESRIPVENLVRALNDKLPAAIRVYSAEEVAEEFHARHSARGKTYRYRIHRGEICPPFLANHVYHHPYPLDEQAMVDAAPLVMGEHDFTSFAATDPERNEREINPVRTIFSSQWQRKGDELIYEVRGSGFLHHMVRNLVGTFLLIGRGVLRPADIARIINMRARSAAGQTAPASGLYLVSVEY
jgi:tRNA pseudouridine38-40 synthase